MTEKPAHPLFTVRMKECPVCRHAWTSHTPEGACREKDCWCLYDPRQEDVGTR